MFRSPASRQLLGRLPAAARTLTTTRTLSQEIKGNIRPRSSNPDPTPEKNPTSSARETETETAEEANDWRLFGMARRYSNDPTDKRVVVDGRALEQARQELLKLRRRVSTRDVTFRIVCILCMMALVELIWFRDMPDKKRKKEAEEDENVQAVAPFFR